MSLQEHGIHMLRTTFSSRGSQLPYLLDRAYFELEFFLCSSSSKKQIVPIELKGKCYSTTRKSQSQA
jgi:hypothetical protein